MKITKSQLKDIIKEELEKVISADDLYLAEMFDTGAVGAGAGGSSLEDKKKQCAAAGGTWVEEGGEYGHCKKPVQEKEELEDWELKDIKSGEAIAAANTPEARAAFEERERKDFLVGRILELWPTPSPPDAEQLMGQSVEKLEGYLKSMTKQSELEEIIKEELEAVLTEKDLSAKERRDLPDSDFALAGKGEGPEGKQAGSYPIPDEKHARSALSLVAQHGTSEEKAKVRAAVKRKFPGIKQGKE